MSTAADSSTSYPAADESIQNTNASETSEMRATEIADGASPFVEKKEADELVATDPNLAANLSAPVELTSTDLAGNVVSAPTDLADEVAKLTVKVEDLTGRVNALTGVSTGGKNKQRRGGKSQRKWKKTKGGRQSKKRR
jgi:hypothetical protein